MTPITAQEARRALQRLNPPLLISGPVVGHTTDTRQWAVCAAGAVMVARSTKRRVEPGGLADHLNIDLLWDPLMNWLGSESDSFGGYAQNDEETCRRRYVHVLAELDMRIRRET